MMSNPADLFVRPTQTRRYKRIFLISTEGGKTEPGYFGRLQNIIGYGKTELRLRKDTHRASPRDVLKRLREAINKTSLHAGDACWCVIDRDQWPQEVIDELIQWATERPASGLVYGLALSAPKFELWLLAHFEDMVGNTHTGPSAVVQKLKCYLPDYDKTLNRWNPSGEDVRTAIRRCRDAFGDDIPSGIGTNMHCLAEAILGNRVD